MEIFQLSESFPKVDSGVHRSGGLHLSDVINAIDKELGISPWNRKKVNLFPGRNPEILFELGFIWEELLSLAYKSRRGFRPDEFLLDGVACSPDNISFDDELEQYVLEEYKLTFKSSNSPIEDNWRWMNQVKSYLKVTELSTVVMRVIYLNGDYKDKSPSYKVFRLTFEQYELDENWQMIVNFAKSKGMSNA